MNSVVLFLDRVLMLSLWIFFIVVIARPHKREVTHTRKRWGWLRTAWCLNVTAIKRFPHRSIKFSLV